MEIFSKRLKAERESKGWSQAQTAKMLGVSQGGYKGYELLGTKNGREPRMQMILEIAELFDVSIDYLFGRKEF